MQNKIKICWNRKFALMVIERRWFCCFVFNTSGSGSKYYYVLSICPENICFLFVRITWIRNQICGKMLYFNALLPESHKGNELEWSHGPYILQLFFPSNTGRFQLSLKRKQQRCKKPSRVQLHILQVAKQQLYIVMRTHFSFLLLVFNNVDTKVHWAGFLKRKY